MQRAGGAGLELIRSLLGRYAPGGRNRILRRTDCLIFAPFITLTVWLLQAVVWLMVGTPILSYALVMAALGGGFSRDHRQH